MSTKRGLQLDKVVLLGRTFAEYSGYFMLEPEKLVGKRVLDVAGGVSSFTTEAHTRGILATSFDPIYTLSTAEIAKRAIPDLERVIAGVQGLPTYRWTAYRDPAHVRELRDRSLKNFLEDYPIHPERYQPGTLPNLPFPDQTFDLTLVSYLLFVYESQLKYQFHRESLLELMRVSKNEVRIYPTVTFEAEPSAYLQQLQSDPACNSLHFEQVPTNFEFLVGSNSFLRVTRKT